MESITIHPLVEEVVEAQAQVGWHHILKGRFVSEWKQAQERYYRGTTRSNPTADVLNQELHSRHPKEDHQPDSEDDDQGHVTTDANGTWD
jgi:hypothetical protein